jgi:diaminopimelate epimerase
MNVKFHKYQGAGNDFILLNNRYNSYTALSESQIKLLCDRHFGIGADGLMLLEDLKGHDFKMVYFNSDGRQSTMCGNGGRCIVRFAQDLKIINASTNFLAIDGPHDAKIEENGIVSLKMIDVHYEFKDGADYILNTGSPHYVVFADSVSKIDIVEEARAIRYSEPYKEHGINVNFVKINDAQSIEIRTYERGVENETLSCGTGVVAASLAFALKENLNSGRIHVAAKGGKLFVDFKRDGNSFTDIWLNGPAVKVFEGSIEI